jgi:hypothetical protein
MSSTLIRRAIGHLFRRHLHRVQPQPEHAADKAERSARRSSRQAQASWLR